MRCSLISPLTTNELEARSVSFTSAQGRLTILEHHAPLLAVIERGDLVIEADNRQKTVYQAVQGYVEVKDNQVTILAEKTPRPLQ